MGKPRKHVTHEQMKEILERRVREASGRHQDPATTIPEVLLWDKPVRNPDGTGYQKTSCRRYSIEKSFVCGTPRYGAFKGKSVIECRDTADEARAVCERDFKKT
jgi:hypothetical protein